MSVRDFCVTTGVLRYVVYGGTLRNNKGSSHCSSPFQHQTIVVQNHIRSSDTLLTTTSCPRNTSQTITQNRRRRYHEDTKRNQALFKTMMDGAAPRQTGCDVDNKPGMVSKPV